MRESLPGLDQAIDLRGHISGKSADLRRDLSSHKRCQSPHRQDCLRNRLSELADDVTNRPDNQASYDTHDLSQNADRRTDPFRRRCTTAQCVNGLPTPRARGVGSLTFTPAQQRRHVRLHGIGLATHRRSSIRPRLRMRPNLIGITSQLIHPPLERFEVLDEEARAPRHQRRNRVRHGRGHVRHSADRG